MVSIRAPYNFFVLILVKQNREQKKKKGKTSTDNDPEQIISGVPKCFTLGPCLFNRHICDLFYETKGTPFIHQ